jgi:hypothetical protein
MRNISPEIFCDEWFGSLDHAQRQLWMGLILALADDQGRMINNPTLIRIKIFPYDEAITNEFINNSIQEFVKAHKLLSYRFGENGATKECLQISKWWGYQKHTTWAAKSMYAAPEGWTDHVRVSTGGTDRKIILENWECKDSLHEPGQPPAHDPAHDHRQPPTHGPALPIVKVKVKEEVKEEVKVKINQPTIPVLTKGPEKKKLVGKVGYIPKIGLPDAIKDLTDQEQDNARIAYNVFLASKIRSQRLVDTSVEVATRILIKGDITDILLAAFASAYDDPAAKNKPMVAAYRILHDTIPAQYFSPNRWKVIPPEILQAAGRQDLNALAAQTKVDAFMGKR